MLSHELINIGVKETRLGWTSWLPTYKKYFPVTIIDFLSFEEIKQNKRFNAEDIFQTIFHISIRI